MMRVSALSCKVAARAAAAVLRRPRYTVGMVVAGLVVSGAIIWSLNYQVLAYVLFDAPLGTTDKLRFYMSGYESLLTTFEPVQAVCIILFSILFGINTAVLIYVVRHQSLGAARHSGMAGVVLGVVGGGCAACGTSLLVPLLATMGLTASASLVRTLGSIVLVLASVVTLFSLYRLGLLAATIQAKQKL